MNFIFHSFQIHKKNLTKYHVFVGRKQKNNDAAKIQNTNHNHPKHLINDLHSPEMRRNIATVAFSDAAATPEKDMTPRRLFEQTPKKSQFRGAQLFSRRTSVFFFSPFMAAPLILLNLYLFRLFVVSPYDISSLPESRISSPTSYPTKVTQQQVQSPVKTPQYTTDTHVVSSLRQIDVEQYTVRINTWRRPIQLLTSVQHLSTCPGVAQIQIIWCDKEEEPPTELSKYTKVVIERHEENSLNERFRILSPPPTRGILSIDDDVIRPCEAIDSGFFKWTKFPDRMVGFDARTHVEKESGTWAYGYMSTTETSNKYSMSLTRFCFIHADYMDMYINALPKEILDDVAQNFNCEDIAMSFLISSKTQGKPSLLADVWALKTMIKLYVQKKISGTKSHKSLRDNCVDTYAKILGIKKEPKKLQMVQYLPTSGELFFDCGDEPSSDGVHHMKSKREKNLERMMSDLKQLNLSKKANRINGLVQVAGLGAYKQGLIENTQKWKDRFGSKR